MLISRNRSFTPLTLKRMGHINLPEVSAHHSGLRRSQLRIIPAILFGQHWTLSLHQVEWNPAAHFWTFVLCGHLNRYVYCIQILLWDWNRNIFSLVRHLYVRMHSQLKPRHHLDQVQNLLVFGLSRYLHIVLGFLIRSPLEIFTLFHLPARCLGLMGTCKERKGKSTILVGQQTDRISRRTAQLHGRTQQSTKNPKIINYQGLSESD